MLHRGGGGGQRGQRKGGGTVQKRNALHSRTHTHTHAHAYAQTQTHAHTHTRICICCTQNRKAGYVPASAILKFAPLFNDNMTLDTLEGPHLRALCKLLNVPSCVCMHVFVCLCLCLCLCHTLKQMHSHMHTHIMHMYRLQHWLECNASVSTSHAPPLPPR